MLLFIEQECDLSLNWKNMTIKFEFIIGFELKKYDILVWIYYCVWISKLCPVGINLKVMTIGLIKKNITLSLNLLLGLNFKSITVRFEFTVELFDTDLAVVARATVLMVVIGVTILAVQWLETLIQWRSSEPQFW